MSVVNIIAFGYRAGVGKNTACEILQKWYEANPEILTLPWQFGFADPLKAACRELFDLTPAQLHNQESKEAKVDYWGLSPRQMFQKVGTGLRAALGNDIFVRHMAKRIDELAQAAYDPIVLIYDVRDPREARMIKDKGGRVFRIDRRDAIVTTAHETENAMNDFNEWSGVIENNGSVEDFRKAVIKIVTGHDV